MKRLVSILFLNLLSPGPLCSAQPIKEATAAPVVIKKTAKAITPATYTGKQVVVGNGGGFTGASTSYYLLENGQLFGRRSHDTTFTFLAKQTTTNTKRIFSKVENSCKIKKTRFDHPGNVYTFVQWRKGKTSYKVTWGATGKKAPSNYPKFYNSFMAMIPASLRLK
ncbi:FAD-binding oxidoreductase [Spirosoma sp. SC4-14]|uniref:FAD-binding oxidoreductase n=1 Tax=Spirosoma sp. SC4-14 TaxID=3128900 RepID=UPI0030CB3137